MDAKLLTGIALAIVIVMAPNLASAHTGLGEAGGLVLGFAHPFSGLDHMLAMVMVGLFASQLRSRALWLVPASFVSIMAVGGAMGLAGLDMPFVELGISLSILVIGAMVAFRFKASIAVAMGLVGFFAIFHGYAHGAEMPAATSALSYGIGFLIATASLHVAGMVAGLVLGRSARLQGAALIRSLGAVASVAGFGVLLGLV